MMNKDNESMNRQSLNELIVSYQVKRTTYSYIDVQKLDEEWKLYSEAGFEQKARELRPRLLFAKAYQKLGNPIVFKRPDFSGGNYYHYSLPIQTMTVGYIDRDDHYRSYYAYREAILLVEAEPSVFTGDVPVSVLKTTLEAKALGFKPYVWLVSPKSKLNEYLSALQRRDPAIVAYPIVGKDNEGDIINNEHGIVLGVWGKDIAEIDKALDKERNQ